MGIKAFKIDKEMEGLMRWRKAMWRKKTGEKRKGICAIPVLLVSTAMDRPAKEQRPGALKSTFE